MANNAAGASDAVGVGIDLVDVARIENMLARYGRTFLEKTFTEAEISHCSKLAAPHIHYAARFAAKEAVVKALGTGFSDDISMKSISVENDSRGAPLALLDAAALARMKELGANKVLISLTHLKDYAQAIAVLSK